MNFVDERLKRLPEFNLGFLLNDIKEIGLSHGGAPINDQHIYYYIKLNNFSLTKHEIDLIKLASTTYLYFDKTREFAPYMPRE